MLSNHEAELEAIAAAVTAEEGGDPAVQEELKAWENTIADAENQHEFDDRVTGILDGSDSVART